MTEQARYPVDFSTVVATTGYRRPDPLIPLAIPHAYEVRPKVLCSEELDAVYKALTHGNPERLAALKEIQQANRRVLETSSNFIGIFLDGRGTKQVTKQEYIQTPDGWWGDAMQASSVIHSLKAAGLSVQTISTQPELFGQNPLQEGIQLPEKVWTMQFYPFGRPDHPQLMEFLFSRQQEQTAFLAPINARLPLFFRLAQTNGIVDFDVSSKELFAKLAYAITGNAKAVEKGFSGIDQKTWNALCHHTQAYQVMTDLLGIDTTQWTQFPVAHIAPPIEAKVLAQQVAAQFSPEMNLFIHPGTNINTPIKLGKVVSVDQWKRILSSLARTRPDIARKVILFEPIVAEQAEAAKQIAAHVEAETPGSSLLLPMERRWASFSTFAALMDILKERGIGVAPDSGPSHVMRARNVETVIIGTQKPDPRFYSPNGAVVVLPEPGKTAGDVDPTHVVQAIEYQADKVLRRS